MIITRLSHWSSKFNTMDLPVTIEQLDRWRLGELIQNVMPELNADQREFLISGMTPDEWEEMTCRST